MNKHKQVMPTNPDHPALIPGKSSRMSLNLVWDVFDMGWFFLWNDNEQKLNDVNICQLCKLTYSLCHCD